MLRRARSKDNGAPGIAMLNWQHQVAEHWPRLRFGRFKVESDANRHVFHVQAYLDELDPDAVRVELYAEGRSGTTSASIMERGRSVDRIDGRI